MSAQLPTVFARKGVPDLAEAAAKEAILDQKIGLPAAWRAAVLLRDGYQNARVLSLRMMRSCSASKRRTGK